MSALTQAPALAGFIGTAQGAGLLGAVATARNVDGWYRHVEKPSWTPPNQVFAPVWTTLYTLMGTSAFLVWQQRHRPEARTALGLWGTQLALNTAWSGLFFGLKAPGAALVDILSLETSIVAYALQARKVSKPAAWLMVPYVAWVAYATALNASIWWKQRK